VSTCGRPDGNLVFRRAARIDCDTRSARICAMRGAPARALQELAGHQDLTTTQRYMHLSPSAVESAIRLLEQQGPASAFAPGATADKEAGHYVCECTRTRCGTAGPEENRGPAVPQRVQSA
jgi:hypothetical protein